MYKIINKLLKERGISKKDFANEVIKREPILKRTKEVPTVKTMYSYLDGTREPDKSVIQAMIDVLDITAIELFDNKEKQKQKIVKEALKNPSQETQRFIDLYCSTQKNFNNSGTIVDGDENSITTNSHNTTPQEPLNHRAMTLLEIFNEKSEQEQRDILKMVLSL